jgi:hypothetical protein
VKRFLYFPFTLCLLIAASTSAQQNTSARRSWSGTLVSAACNAKQAFAEAPECFKPAPNANLALADDTVGVLYQLETRELTNARLGDAVTVRGSLADETIRVTSIAPMSIGLEVGQKAPPFSRCKTSSATPSPSIPSKDRRALCCSFSVPPIGDPFAKSSWSSCKPLPQGCKSKA